MRRLVITLLLALALTGCSSLLGPGTATQTPSPTPTATESPAAASYPTGYGPKGVIAPAKALDAHSQGLIEAGSFFLEYNGTAISENRTSNVYSAQVVNLTADRAYVVTNVRGGGSTVQYFTNDSIYIRQDSPGENNTQFSSSKAKVYPRNFTGRGLYGPLVRYAEWSPANRTGPNGSFIVYRATSLTRVKPVFGQNADAANVTNFSATLVVGPEGVIRSVTYGGTVVRDRKLGVSVSIVTKKIGNTTVQPPSWLEKAKGS